MKTNTINDLHTVSNRFLRSAQLERDFEDATALEGYVVTEEVKEYLGRIAKGLQENSVLRSWRITGDFGSGKSSFALLLANILGKQNKVLPKHIQSLCSDLKLPKQSKPYLPILVTGAREELSSAIIKNLATVVNSKKSLPKNLKSVVKINQLFKSGVATDKQILNVIQSFSKEIVSSGKYGGVLIVLDELGKFLEYAALYPQRQDVYFLQQLGEFSSRSEEYPIITVGMLHQGFSAYADKLSDSAQKEWEKIGGRYEGMSFSQPMTQVASLIAAALQVKQSASIRGWKKDAQDFMQEAISLGMYGASEGKSTLCELAPDLYPIHPTVLPVLRRFFRRFGQNERSLFSFLYSSEPHALPAFGAKVASRNSVYTLADFYDYAEENFSHKLSAQSFRSHWNHIDSVITALKDEDEGAIRILKVIGILNVIESEDFRPTKEIISLSLSHSSNIEPTLNKLVKKVAIFNRGARRGYSLWPNTSINLEQAFSDASDKITVIPKLADVATQHLDPRPIVARRHYISKGTLRYFDVRYLTLEAFLKLSPESKAIHPADGVINIILCEKQDECSKANKHAKFFAENTTSLIAVSPPLEGLHGHALDLARWTWIEQKYGELKDDRFAAEEVASQISIITDVIQNWLNQFLNIRGLKSDNVTAISWYYKGKSIHGMNEGRSLQMFLSDLCSETLFPKAPIAKNELINRDALSASAAGARQKLFEYMLGREAEPKFGFTPEKAPPEKSIYLSVLEAGRLHREIEGRWKIAFPDTDEDPCNFLPALQAVVEKLEQQAEKRVKVSDLYDVLRAPVFGVRDGLIPLLLLTVYIEHESEIAVYEDDVFQAEIEPFLMMRLVKKPETFEFQMCRINNLRRELVDKLTKVINENGASNGDILGIVKPLCMFLAGLPEYVQKTDKLSSRTLQLRKEIANASEPSDLVFRAIPEVLGIDINKPDTLELTKRFKASIVELRRAFPQLQERMSESILSIFNVKDQKLSDWRNEISEQAETILIGARDADLRAFSMKLSDDRTGEPEWLESLGSMISRKPPSKWLDKDEDVFHERLKLLANQFQRVLTTYFDENGALPDSAIRLAVTPRTGDERDIVITLSDKKMKEVDALRDEMKSLLNSDRQVSLAAMSRVVWDLLEENNDT